MNPSSHESPTDHPPDRRRFVGSLVAFSIVAALGGVLTPILGYLRPPTLQSGEHGSRVRVASLTEIQAVGGLVAPANNKPVVVTATQGTDVHAFSAICTHLGCVVGWKNAGKYIQCPCHDARFNAQTGAVISGPAPSPLSPYEVVVEGDDVFVIT